MRHRVRVESARPPVVHGVGRNDEKTPLKGATSSCFPNSYQWYNGAGTDYWSTSDMYDDPTRPGVEVNPYKICNHSIVRAASIGESNIILQYSPPTPPLEIGMTGAFRLATKPTPSAIDWTNLVVNLSEQVGKAVTSKFMGAVFLKELREGVAMIRNPFGLITKKLVRKIPRGMTAHTGSSLKNMSSFWLEYRYGWTPLLSDVTNFSKLLANFMNQPEFDAVLHNWQRLSASQRATVSAPSAWIYPSGYSDSYWNYLAGYYGWPSLRFADDIGIFRYRTFDYECNAHVTCEQFRAYGEVATVMQSLLAVLQLGSWQQIRDTLWEVLPFSFVVDWFINFNNIWKPIADTRLQDLDIRGLGWSLKTTQRYKCETLVCFPRPVYLSDSIWFGQYPVNAPGANRIISGGIGSSSLFTRTSGFPPLTDDVFRKQGLSVLQQLDGLSLSMQKILSTKWKK